MSIDEQTGPSVPDDTLTYDERDAAQAVPPSEHTDQRYVLGVEHARGGIGRIVRATDRKLERDVAIKELLHHGDRARARFAREARITARLEHPSVVPVHDAGHWPNGRPYYAMKLVSGRSLKEAIDETTSLRERLGLLPNVIAVCEAIGYAHSVGVIHRDLKPANVLVGGYGETVVIDWGLAKELDNTDDDDDPIERGPYRAADDDVTVAGSVLGTPAFMAPEQANGEPVDERADVYALGAMLYHVLSGKTPYEGSSDEVVSLVRERPPAPLTELVAGISPDLAAIVAKAMARNPDARYRDGGALAEDLRRYRTGQLVGAHDYSWAQLMARWTRRNRALALTVIVFLVAATAGTVWFFNREQDLRRAAEAERDRARQERDRAESEQERADRQTRVLLEQEGRRELDAGRPFRAAVYLAEVLRRTPERPAPRWLVSQALRAMRAYVRHIPGIDRQVIGVDISRDGTLIATGSGDDTMRIWDASTGRELHRRSFKSQVESVAFGADNRIVAVGVDGQTLLWHRATDTITYAIDAFGYRLAVSPDGRQLVIGTQGSEVVVVEIESGRILGRWRRPDGRISGAAWLPDGTHFVTSDDAGEVLLWRIDGARGPRKLASHVDPLSGVSVSPDGQRVLVSSYGEDYFIHDVRTGQLLTRRRLADGTQIAHAYYRPDGRTMVVGAIDGVVRVVHAISGATLAAFDALHEGRLNGLAITPDGNHVATAGVGGHVALWRLDNLGFRARQIGAGEDEGYPGQVAWLDDGKLLAVGDYAGVVSIRKGDTDEVLRTLQLETNVMSMSLNRDGTRLVNNGNKADQPRPRLWDVPTGNQLSTFEAHTSRVYHNDASRDRTRVATSSYDGTVRQWDFDGKPVGAVLRSTDGRRFTAVAHAPDDRRIATSDDAGLLQVWDRETGEELMSVQAHASWIQDIHFSPDSKRVATAGRLDLMVKIWDSTSGENLLTTQAQRGNVLVVRFTGDGKVIATAGTDDVLNLRDAATGELLRTIPGPRVDLAFHPSHDEMITAGPDEYLVSWQLAIDDRNAETIADEIRDRSPWRLRDGRLELAAPP